MVGLGTGGLGQFNLSLHYIAYGCETRPYIIFLVIGCGRCVFCLVHPMFRIFLLLFRLLRVRGVLSIISRLPKYLRLSWRLLWDARVPSLPKLFVVLAVLYGLSPFDLIPEAILPHIGLGDDIVLVILSIRNLIATSPQNIVQEHAHKIVKKS